MNFLFLCFLTLALQGTQEPSNPPAPGARMAAEDDQSCGNHEKDKRDVTEQPEKPRRDSALPTQISSDSVPVQKESEGTDPNKHPSKKYDAWVREWSIPAFTLGLLIIAALQYWLNRRAFYATNRPRLRVRRLVVIKKIPGPNILLHYLQTGFSVKYSVTNIGGSKATIVQESIGLHIVNDIGVGDIEPQWKNDLSGGTEVPVGEPFVGVPIQTLKLKDYEFRGVMQRRLFAYLIGGVRYKDGNGVPYETAFCRRFNTDTMRFDTVESSDYEYED